MRNFHTKPLYSVVISPKRDHSSGGRRDCTGTSTKHHASAAMLDWRTPPTTSTEVAPQVTKQFIGWIDSFRVLRTQKLLIFLIFAVCVFGLYQIFSVNYFIKEPVFIPWREQCQPRFNVAFMKTHKTASSSVQNIFLRYANTHKLFVALPAVGNYFGHPELFIQPMVPKLQKGLYYNIFCHHHRWNYYEVRKLMPADTVYVTILRDPAHLFESLYSYYRLYKTFNMSLAEFASANDSIRAHHNKRFYRKIGRNQMSFDLGLSENYFEDEDLIKSFIQNLDRQFSLVMIVERIEESLILLKHLLCWSVDDVVIFRHNVRLPTKKTTLEDEVIDGLQKWNRADQMLYDHFQQRLHRQIQEFGWERMKQEVEELQNRINFWYDLCIESEDTYENLERKFRAYSNQVFGFRLKESVDNITCENLAKAEIPFTNELRIQQIPYYSSHLPMKRSRSSYLQHLFSDDP